MTICVTNVTIIRAHDNPELFRTVPKIVELSCATPEKVLVL